MQCAQFHLSGANYKMPTAALPLLFACTLTLASLCPAQQPAPDSANLPAFAAATIKPHDPKAQYWISGFYGDPGGRIFFGGNLKMLVRYAFNLQDSQIGRGPAWISSQWFEINAVPPDGSPSLKIKVRNVEPTSEQRLMLQSLLADRFGLRYHLEAKEGEVYLLTRGTKPPQLKPPKDPASDPRAIVMMKQGGIDDGEAIGTNTSIDYLAKRLGEYLQLPVLNQTGITGSYDFYLPPDDPDNHDMVVAVRDVLDRLGMKLKHSRGPIQTLIIDNIEQPSPN